MKMMLPGSEQEQIEYIHDAILDYFKGSNQLAREWFESENELLHGHTPIKEIRLGNIEVVFKIVRKLVENNV